MDNRLVVPGDGKQFFVRGQHRPVVVRRRRGTISVQKNMRETFAAGGRRSFDGRRRRLRRQPVRRAVRQGTRPSELRAAAAAAEQGPPAVSIPSGHRHRVPSPAVYERRGSDAPEMLRHRASATVGGRPVFQGRGGLDVGQEGAFRRGRRILRSRFVLRERRPLLLAVVVRGRPRRLTRPARDGK